MAKGNLDVSLSEKYLGDFAHIHEALDTIIVSLNGMIREISVAAGQVAAGSRQVSDSSQVCPRELQSRQALLRSLRVPLRRLQNRQNRMRLMQAMRTKWL